MNKIKAVMKAPILQKKWERPASGVGYVERGDMCDLCYEREKAERAAAIAEIQRLFPKAVPRGKKYVLYWLTDIHDIGAVWWIYTKYGEYYFDHFPFEAPDERDIDVHISTGDYISFSAWGSMTADRLQECANFLKLKIK